MIEFLLQEADFIHICMYYRDLVINQKSKFIKISLFQKGSIFIFKNT